MFLFFHTEQYNKEWLIEFDPQTSILFVLSLKAAVHFVNFVTDICLQLFSLTVIFFSFINGIDNFNKGIFS